MLLRIITALSVLHIASSSRIKNENYSKHAKSQVGDLLQNIFTLNQQKIRVLDKINKIKKDENFRKVFRHSADFRKHINDTVNPSDLLVLVVPKTNNSEPSRKSMQDSRTRFAVKKHKIRDNSDEINSSQDTGSNDKELTMVNDQKDIGSENDISGSTSDANSKNNNSAVDSEENTSASEMFFKSHDSKPLPTQSPKSYSVVGRKHNNVKTNKPQHKIETENQSKIQILRPKVELRKNIIPTYEFQNYLEISDMDDIPHQLENDEMRITHIATSKRRPQKVKDKKNYDHVTEQYEPFIKYERQRFPMENLTYERYTTYPIEVSLIRSTKRKKERKEEEEEIEETVTSAPKKKKKKKNGITETKNVLAENSLKFNSFYNKAPVTENKAKKTMLSKHELEVLHAKYPNSNIIQEDYPNVYVVVSEKPVTDRPFNPKPGNNENKDNYAKKRINLLVPNGSTPKNKHMIENTHKKVKTEGLSLASIYSKPISAEITNEMQVNIASNEIAKHEKNENLRQKKIQTSTPNHISEINDSFETNLVARNLKINNYDLSRKNWKTDLSKQATKQCKRSCVEAYRNVCTKLKCAKKAKASFKRNCKRSCRRSFSPRN